MYVNLVFELSMVLDNEKFHKTINRVYKRAGYLDENENEYIDQCMASKGIVVKYRDSQYKKKVKLTVNAKLVSDSDEIETHRFIEKLDKRIKEYFGYRYQMEDFSLAGATLTADIDVEDHENVMAYLKVLQRIGRVKGYSPSGYDCFEKKACFCLHGNSNGIEFMVYDLEGMLAECLKKADTGRKKTGSMIVAVKGILRTEVRLTKPKAIRFYTNDVKVSVQMAELAANRQDIFLDVFTQIIPFGDYYKKDKATEIIQKDVRDNVMRRKMLRLLVLIPKKKSLYLAQKAMNYRNMEKVMDAFAKINVSPVTLSKRHDIKYLKCLYSILLGERQL